MRVVGGEARLVEQFVIMDKSDAHEAPLNMLQLLSFHVHYTAIILPITFRFCRTKV